MINFFSIWYVDQSQKTTHGIFYAQDKNEFLNDFTSFDLKVLRIKPVLSSVTWSFSDENKANWYQNLAILLQSDFPLEKALDFLVSNSSQPHMKALSKTLLVYALHGKPFTTHQNLAFFDPLATAGLMQAAQTGALASMCHDLAKNYTDNAHIKDNIRQLIRYPLLVLTALFCVIFVLANILLPAIDNMALGTLAPGSHIETTFAQKSLRWVLFNQLYIIGVIIFISLVLFKMKHVFYKIPAVTRLQLFPFWQQLMFCLRQQMPYLKSIELAMLSVNSYVQANLISFQNLIEKGDHRTAANQLNCLPAIVKIILEHAFLCNDLQGGIARVVEIETAYRKNIMNSIMLWTQPLILFMMGLVVLWILYATLIPLYDNMSEVF